MNIFFQIIISVTGVVVFLFLGLFSYKFLLKYATKITTANGISSLEAVTLGDLKQWIFIRGRDQNNPVLLFLHGGPGAPLLGMAGSRKYDAELIKHFTVVHWDQRGAGKSFYRDIPIESMTLDRFVEDCNELIEYLRERLHTQKVFLVAHSGGTIIGMKTAHKYPEKIHAYVGVTQVINEYEQHRVSYDFIVKKAEQSGDLKRQTTIQTIGPPPYDSPKTFLQMEGLVSHYGGFMYKMHISQMLALMLSFVTSPEYSLPEGIRTVRNEGFEFTTNTMWEELRTVNLTQEIHSMNVPIYLFEGKYDVATPTVVVETFFENLEAEKGKTLIIFEKSGHMPIIEEKAKYEDLLINLVLKENLKN